jgi:hypothetical protein
MREPLTLINAHRASRVPVMSGLSGRIVARLMITRNFDRSLAVKIPRNAKS